MRIERVSPYTPSSGILLSVFNIHMEEPSVLLAVKFFPLLCLHSFGNALLSPPSRFVITVNVLTCYIINSNIFLSDHNFYPTHSTFSIILVLFCFDFGFGFTFMAF